MATSTPPRPTRTAGGPPGRRAPGQRTVRAHGSSSVPRQTSRAADLPADAPRGVVRRAGHRVTQLLARVDTPATSFYLLVTTTAVLVVVGLVMVLSSSSVEAMQAGQSPFADFTKQLMWAVIGLPLAWLASHLPVRAWKRLAWPALAGAVLLQLLVFSPLGISVNGNRNWIGAGGMTLQPSEFGKLALAVWCAAVLARKRHLLHRWAHVVVPVVPGALLLLGLVLLGHDLGTGMVLMLVIATALWVGGVPWRFLAVPGAGLIGIAALLVLTSANRRDRIEAWLSGDCDALGACFQSVHGMTALASGGLTGLGLGSSREKWSYLPEAHNDFIFAIIGEELGLVGTLVVVALFATLAVGCMRVVRRHDDVFVKIATAAVMAWVTGQALVNMAVVLGLLPVIGIPLPLVSYGGSSLVATMVALGMVLSFARTEPGASAVLATRSGAVRRSLVVAAAPAVARARGLAQGRSRRRGVR